MFRRLEFACAALLLGAVVVLVGLAAVTRAMGTPIIWSVEIAQLLFLWLCILAIDLALQEERHFGLRIVQDNVSPRIGRIVEMINLLIMVALLAFLIRYAWRNTLLMHTRLDGALQIRGSYLHASMVIGFALMIRSLLARLALLARKRT
ncbi:TRAP transporter small permease [Aquibium microcysteis]|uniref:TRAP transporter small permease n=1 Tax=Aquibium microcysteis TaxID=675281 RepID=UPI00165D1BAA|nr:TRAP transporter small permease subunit [Aquibium microcysteis]